MMLAQLAPAVDGFRMSLHVLAAAVWVGGQITVVGMLPTVRKLGEEAPKRIARAFARVSWPAYVLVLATGVWNVMVVGDHRGSLWGAVLGAKIAVVLLAGLAALLHTRSKTPRGVAAWGAVTGLSSVTALAMGVFLAG